MENRNGRQHIERWLQETSILKPEGDTSVSLSKAISSICGAESSRKEAINATEEQSIRNLVSTIGDSRHVLFVLVDGLGINQRERFPAGGFFSAHLDRTIRSVFPSTTATALTSLGSAAWPATHAITGWFTHLPEYGKTVIPLRAVDRSGENPIDAFGIPYSDVIKVESIYPLYTAALDVFTYRGYRAGGFADWYRGDTRITTYRNLNQAARRIRRRLNHRVRSETPSFGYAYFSEVDHLSHINGRTHDSVITYIAQIDAMLKDLRRSLPDEVRMVVTADHGHIDIPQERHYLLPHDDELLSLLECPPSGEARIPIFHVVPGKEDEFETAFHEKGFGDFVLITPDDIEALGLYGPEPLSDETRRRLGTFIGISQSADAIEYVSEGRDSVGHIGMHGGLSKDEVEIPLFIA